MTIQSSGEISLGGSTTGRSVNLTLGKTATATVSMNDTAVRGLAGVATGAVSFSNFYSKSLSYAITPNVSSVNEGGSVTFTVTTTGLLNGTVLYWSTPTSTGITAADFSGSSLTGSVTINNNLASIVRTLNNDAFTEGTESFQLQLRTGSTSGTVVATSSTVTISDTSTTPPPTYSITPSVTSVNEGSSVSFTVNTTNVSNNTTLYYTISGVSGTINTSDFSPASLTGSFVINNNTATFSSGIRADSFTEGTESFRLQVRTVSTSGTIVATSATITINDTSLTPPPPQIVFTSSGTWTVPAGVTSVSIFSVAGGGGGKGRGSAAVNGQAAGGAGSAYRNNAAVSPGDILTITIGAGGAGALERTNPGGDTRVLRNSDTVNPFCECGGGSQSGQTSITGVGGRLVGGITRSYLTYGQGANGAGGSSLGGFGGGGAAGYGNVIGGSGGTLGASSAAGQNGGGSGGGSTTSGTGRVGGKGGGVGLLGQGTAGAAVATVNATQGTNGNNGSGGSFGAGGGGGNVTTVNTGKMNGNSGAVRIMWPGNLRLYPATRTADE